jgi:hypothetical protein
MQLGCCHPGARKAGDARDVLRELARARRKQLDLALRGDILASAAYAEHARQLRRRLAPQGGAAAREAVPA